ncbi:MAG: 30S ribosomal protein S6 [Planctomycetes bacterium]|nr:30S ribosomal protein S6 [Planctomycetota bacterium]
MRRYEGMFLFDNAVAHEWSGIEQEVRRLCDRIGAELEVCVKYDERKLAYEINRRKRGTYVLTYFQSVGDRINDLERDVRLSELVLRVLVLRADNVAEERIAELKARSAEEPLSPGSGDGRRHWDDERPRRERPPRSGDRGRDGFGRASDSSNDADNDDESVVPVERPPAKAGRRRVDAESDSRPAPGADSVD